MFALILVRASFRVSPSTTVAAPSSGHKYNYKAERKMYMSEVPADNTLKVTTGFAKTSLGVTKCLTRTLKCSPFRGGFGRTNDPDVGSCSSRPWTGKDRPSAPGERETSGGDI